MVCSKLTQEDQLQIRHFINQTIAPFNIFYYLVEYRYTFQEKNVSAHKYKNLEKSFISFENAFFY